jgi:putative endonuclease
MRATDALGRYGETVAARHLEQAGLVILARNWRCEIGEVDIVARDGNVLVICEVKTRRSTRYGRPAEAVTRAKAARLRMLAARWVTQCQARPEAIRIDVVSVLSRRRGAADVEHLRGVA